jgi:putative ATPase
MARQQTASLFAQQEERSLRAAQPLAARMRPQTLDEFVGQRHLLGDGKLLRRLVLADRLTSLIFYGPPGTGKTTLARLLAKTTGQTFRQLNAVTSSVKELREVLDEARQQLSAGGPKTLLFIDEIHRFNRAQQDALLPDVEEGIVTFVGATANNPFFFVNPALISRSHVFEFEPLSAEEIKHVLLRALNDKERGLGMYEVHMHVEALNFLAETCDGDARRALNALEIGVLSSSDRPIEFTRQLAEESLQRKAVVYDAAGDSHYDTASALIKSLRGSDAWSFSPAKISATPIHKPCWWP